MSRRLTSSRYLPEPATEVPLTPTGAETLVPLSARAIRFVNTSSDRGFALPLPTRNSSATATMIRRLWMFFIFLGILLTLYLAGILLISTVTLDAQHKGSQGSGSRSRGAVPLGVGIRAASRRNRLQWCQALRFLEQPGPVVALASFPGSGNTWVRYLLQQVTGIYTGSVYKDYSLLKNGFPAESVVNGSVSVVKTHEWGPAARQPFSRAVLLIRAPGPAIQAEFNRQSGGHIGFASPDRYRRNKGKYWQQFVADKLSAWRQTNLDWLHNFTGPMHVMFYDQLIEDVATHLQELLRFLKLNVSEQNMACALEWREGIYRRKRRVINFDPFTTAMKQALRKEQDDVYEAIANSPHKSQALSVKLR